MNGRCRVHRCRVVTRVAPSTRRPTAEHGTSIMEALVALVLFTGVVVALYQAVIAGSRSVRRADQEVAATAVAMAQLATAGIETPLEESRELTGVDNGYTWRLSVTRFAGADERTQQSRLAAYWVTVDVMWRDGGPKPRTLQMRTLKLGLKP